jgi:ABC-type Mn2+/Zn2+ transport system ATPase subunit
MPLHSVTVECPVLSSFAVDQVRGMFDLAKSDVARETFRVELPGDDEDWRIGVIVGPSGSGKTTVARSAYGERFVEGGFRWEKKKAVVDHFPNLSMKFVTQTLTSVGFSSPPAWVKPHHVLSGGERFRCDLARALLRPGELVAFDEFTSVVDRTVAKIGSAAIAKSIRKSQIAKKFVAVTCHYDVLDWLEPDWVLDMATQQLARGCLHPRGCLHRRPTIELEVAPVHRGAWQLFRRHHYLNHELHTTAKCFVAFWPQENGNSEPVAFSSWMTRMTRGRRELDMREHRTVVLPDFQGVGIGNRVSELCASIFCGAGGRAFSTTSHPGMIHYRHASPKWRTHRFGMVAPTGGNGLLRKAQGKQLSAFQKERLKHELKHGPILDSCGRVTAGFEYVGAAMDRDQAAAMLAARPRIFGDPACERVLAVIPAGGASRSVRSIAARTRLSIDEVTRAVLRLEKSGDIDRQRVGKRYFYVSR